jgi:hypothetical protein
MFEYEHSSKNHVGLESREGLISEIEGDEFHLSPIQGKLMLNDFETILNEEHGKSLPEIENKFIDAAGEISEGVIREMFSDLRDFTSTEPNLPDIRKNFVDIPRLSIHVDDSREAIAAKIAAMSGLSEMARLTLYVYRQMDVIDWLPFVKAAIERNPVSYIDLNGKMPHEVHEMLLKLPGESIYDSARLALPDEVWNFRRGDGIEKALLLASYIHYLNKDSFIIIDINQDEVILKAGETSYSFISEKGLIKRIEINGNLYRING